VHVLKSHDRYRYSAITQKPDYSWPNGSRLAVHLSLNLEHWPSGEDLGLPVAVLPNNEVYDYCPEVVAAYRERGDEIVGHGRTNAERQCDMSAKK
jgi:allantoinase